MLKISGEIEMRNDKDEMLVLGAIFGFLAGAILASATFFIVTGIKNESLRVEAIKTGHAEYVVNEYGKTTFKFKDCADKKEGL